jgi:hypothetical protein
VAAALHCAAVHAAPTRAVGEPGRVTYHAVVSNRYELDAAQLVRWHREKAGTIEHVHRVLKNELGAGVLPSARFGANAAWFRINTLTFNVLSVLKRRALPERFNDARPKRLRYELFTLAGELAVHQSQLSLRECPSVSSGSRKSSTRAGACSRCMTNAAARSRAEQPRAASSVIPGTGHRRASASPRVPVGVGAEP